MLLRRLLAPIAAALVLSACPTTPGTGTNDGGSSSPAAIGQSCSQSSDCSSNDCFSGVCVATCSSGCPSGSVCSYTPKGSYCFGTCSAGSSSSCPSNTTCTAVEGGEACIPNGTAVCTQNSNCASGSTCITGACVPGTCTVSADCPASWQCVANACVAPNGACTSNSDCHSPDTCIAGVCTNPGDGCANDTDCTSPATCINGMCVTPNPQCTSSSQCSPGWTCITGTCVAPAGTDAGPQPGPDAGPQPGPDAGPVVCLSEYPPYGDAACPPPEVCGIDGVCVAPCTATSCPAGETCSQTSGPAQGHCVGTAGTGFPAAAGSPPQVVKSSGSVLSSPKVIPVFFGSDSLAPSIVSYLKALPGSPYWAAAGEYGVNSLTIGTPVTLAAAAANISDSKIQQTLTQQVSSGTLPAEDGNTIYALHYQSNTTISLGQGEDSCQAFGGYHANTQGGLPYAVIPRCPGDADAGFPDIDVLTVAESHELIEASTDPLPDSTPAYVQCDNAHLYWDAVQGGSEIADMCEDDPEAYDNQIPGLTSWYVQRFWSNASIKAGHDPCVPEFTGTVFFQSVPELNDSISINATGEGNVTAKGVSIPLNSTGTVTIDLFSDGATADWLVNVQDFTSWSQETACQSETECDGSTMDISISAASGNNGDTITATIKPVAAPANGTFPGSNYDVFVITSTQPSTGNQHFWYGLVGE